MATFKHVFFKILFLIGGVFNAIVAIMAFANTEALRIENGKNVKSGIMLIITSVLFFICFGVMEYMKKEDKERIKNNIMSLVNKKKISDGKLIENISNHSSSPKSGLESNNHYDNIRDNRPINNNINNIHSINDEPTILDDSHHNEKQVELHLLHQNTDIYSNNKLDDSIFNEKDCKQNNEFDESG